jgi:hypothetical protein
LGAARECCASQAADLAQLRKHGIDEPESHSAPRHVSPLSRCVIIRPPPSSPWLQWPRAVRRRRGVQVHSQKRRGQVSREAPRKYSSSCRTHARHCELQTRPSAPAKAASRRGRACQELGKNESREDREQLSNLEFQQTNGNIGRRPSHFSFTSQDRRIGCVAVQSMPRPRSPSSSQKAVLRAADCTTATRRPSAASTTLDATRPPSAGIKRRAAAPSSDADRANCVCASRTTGSDPLQPT